MQQVAHFSLGSTHVTHTRCKAVSVICSSSAQSLQAVFSTGTCAVRRATPVEDFRSFSAVERTRVASWGQARGTMGQPAAGPYTEVVLCDRAAHKNWNSTKMVMQKSGAKLWDSVFFKNPENLIAISSVERFWASFRLGHANTSLMPSSKWAHVPRTCVSPMLVWGKTHPLRKWSILCESLGGLDSYR